LHRGGHTEETWFARDGVEGLGIEMATGPLVFGTRAIMGNSEEGRGHSFLGSGGRMSLFTGTESEVLVSEEVVVSHGRNLGLLWNFPPTGFVENFADELANGNHFGRTRRRDMDFWDESECYLFISVIGIGVSGGSSVRTERGETGRKVNRDD